jgi:hypothetical protein
MFELAMIPEEFEEIREVISPLAPYDFSGSNIADRAFRFYVYVNVKQ